MSKAKRIIRYGDSTFINMDCIKGAIAHLPDESVDLIITDPPYGIDGDKLHQHYNRDERFVVDGYVEVPKEQYNAFSHAWIQQAERVLRPGGQIFIVSGYTNLYDILDALRETSLQEINHLIWKYNFGVHTTQKFVSSHYHILYYAKPGSKRTFNLQCRFATNERHEDGGSANYHDREDVWIINREYKPGREKNKNELPTKLLTKMLEYASTEGQLVCDFFMGGCSTAAVAIALNRRFIGFELSPSIFSSRVPAIKKVTPGEMLSSLRNPKPFVLPNRGKAWSVQDTSRLRRRYQELSAKGLAKGAIITMLCDEFERGSFSIVKRLKTIDGNPKTGTPRVPLRPTSRPRSA